MQFNSEIDPIQNLGLTQSMRIRDGVIEKSNLINY